MDGLTPTEMFVPLCRGVGGGGGGGRVREGIVCVGEGGVLHVKKKDLPLTFNIRTLVYLF